MSDDIKSGCSVTYFYTTTNSCIPWHNIFKRKFGVFIRKVKHTCRYSGEQMAYVKFDGNRTISKVPINFIKQGEV